MTAKLTKLAPGLVVALLNLIAPFAAYSALFLSPDPRIDQVFKDATAAGIVDVHAQVSIVFVSSIVVLISAVLFYFRPNKRRSGKAISLGIVIITGGLFLWIFALGGAALLPLDPYMRPSSPGVIHFPPLDSWLTWVRYALIVLAALLSFIQFKGVSAGMDEVGP